MKFIIRDTSWAKRRTPVSEPKAVSVIVAGLELIDNHVCEMVATYDDGNSYTLSARVTLNQIYTVDGSATPENWTVQGLDSIGHSVLCDIEGE